MALAQTQVTVSGTVKDSQGPVAGAAVLEKGTSNGTVTDIDGNWTLKVTEGATVAVSFIGYDHLEVPATPGTPMNLMLQEESTELGDVVVIGYGAMKKSDLTGSIVQVQPSKLASQAPKTVQDVLRSTPGLNVGYSDEAKGGGGMQLRGQRSVYTSGGHNDPLIILDGMQFYGELSEINPLDIQQIDILKDASAAAVYGAKGANGVVVITTKKGKKGKPVVNVSATLSAGKIAKLLRYNDVDRCIQHRVDWWKKDTYGVNEETGEYGEYYATDKKGKLVAERGYYDSPEVAQQKYGVSLEAWRAMTDNEEGETDRHIWGRRLGYNNNVLENFAANKTHDWWDESMRTGFSQDYTVSVGGASDNVNYYLSVGFQRNQGVIRGDDYKALRANMKINGEITKWLEVGANVNFQNRSDGDLRCQATSTNYWDDNNLRNSPFADFRDEEGNYAQYPHGKQDGGYNYDFERQYLTLSKGYTTLNTIFDIKLKFPVGITYTFNIAPRFQWFFDRYHMSADKPNSNPDNQGVNRGNAKRFDYSLNNNITWDYTFAERHHVVLTAVQEAEERRYWHDYINARGMEPSDALGYHITANSKKDLASFGSDDAHETAAAYMVRLFYGFDNRYLITGTWRRDGYCAFGNNNPWANFGSVSFAWSFARERFFHFAPMSTGKFRISWGKNGNRSLGDPLVALANLGVSGNTTMNYFKPDGTPYDIKFLSISRMANPNLEWEKTRAVNFGLDFGFLDDRFTGSLEVYNMYTEDMIMDKRLPNFSGFSNITTNLGEVQNVGVELTLNTGNILRDNFEWHTSFGLSHNKNEIKHLYYEDEEILDEEGNVVGIKERDDESNNWHIGQPISEIWDFKQTGIWQCNEWEEAARYGQRPGDPKVENYYTADDKDNGDGTTTPVYNNKDKQFLGQTEPKVRLSMRNEFKLPKNFEFSFSMYSYLGHRSMSSLYMNNDNSGSLMTKQFNATKKQYWTPENASDKYPRLDAKAPAGAGAAHMYNASFCRLDNMSLSYHLPQEITQKAKIDLVKMFFTVRNVACFGGNWEFNDKETHGLSSRTFTFGLNVTL